MEDTAEGVAFHLNWCLSFVITSNVIADIWRAFQWDFSKVGYLTDMINLRCSLDATRLYDEKISCILKCALDFQLIMKPESKDCSGTEIMEFMNRF
jgi:hypothetical protein